MPIDFKKVKSLFIEEVNNPAQQGRTENKGKSETPPPADPSKVIRQESAVGEKGQISAQFTEILLGALEKNNLSGMDYLEFKQSLKSLEKMPMDEKVRYQSAFAMAQTMGATPQKLVESADHYLNILKGEESKFEKALANQEATRIANRKDEISKLDQAILQKAEEIKKLTQEMEKHRAEMEHLQAEIQEATKKMETTKNDFIASYNALVSQILRDVENMKNYLK